MENLLTHYTTFYSFYKILRSQHFIAFYNKEEITSDLHDDSTKSSTLLIPMVCFCDSDVNVSKHIKTYGEIGISFEKSWGVQRGLIPVMYIHRNSKIGSKLKTLFEESGVRYSKAKNGKEIDITLKTHKELFTLSLFTKPYDGYFEKTGSDQCFYLEREWRYIPEKEKQVEYSQSKEVMKAINDKILDDPSFYLYFGYNDIVNLFTTNEHLEKLVTFLIDEDKKELIRKIHII
jgi:hypothetical protein